MRSVNDQPYQLLPPLSPDEYAALRADIEANGIRVPVDVDEDGQILDGHHRRRIAAELGIPCPTRLLAGLTEDDKRAHAVAVNVHRRTLTISQRRDLVRAELARDPSRSDRAIGRLCGVDGKTVAAMRVRNSAPVEEFTPEQKAKARELTNKIRDHLFRLDMDVIVELIRGTSPMQIVGELTASWHEFERSFANDREVVDAMRPVIYVQRVNDVLGWPTSGWYAEQVRDEADELAACLVEHR
jgi:hypothetical protein